MLPKRPASTILDFFKKSKLQELLDDTNSSKNGTDTTNETPVLPEQSDIHISKSSIHITDENTIFESSNDCLSVVTIDENMIASNLLQSVENKNTQSSSDTDSSTHSQRLPSRKLSTAKRMFARIRQKENHVLYKVVRVSSKNKNIL
jgi:hypothetical protein